MIITFHPCPGNCGGRVCGADLYPRLWTAMQAQLRAMQKPPSAGWVVVTVSCPSCGTRDMQFRVRYSTEPVLVEVKQ